MTQADIQQRYRNLLKYLAIGVGVLVAIATGLEFLIEHKSYFKIDGSYFFYPIFTMTTCFAFIIVGRVIGAIVRRTEHYYKEDNND